MNKIVALTLTASIALASLTGCAAKDAQQKETNVSGISNSEENDNRDNDSQYQDPENIVFEDDMSATIDLPVDDIKVMFEGKELMPGRDTAEGIKASFPDTFTDNSRFNINRWNPEYIVGSNAELTVSDSSDDYKTEDEPNLHARLGRVDYMTVHEGISDKTIEHSCKLAAYSEQDLAKLRKTIFAWQRRNHCKKQPERWQFRRSTCYDVDWSFRFEPCDRNDCSL